MWRACRHWLCLLGCALAPVACGQSQAVNAMATVVTVGPDEGGAGIQKALLSLRELRKQAGPALREPLRVVLLPGQYVLAEPLRIAPEDSGTEAAPTIIEASQPGTAELVGAPKLLLLRADEPAWLFTPPMSVDRAAERSGGQFFVNGRRATLAQQPNEGQAYFVAKALSAESGQVASKEIFQAEAADVSTLLPMVDGDRDRAIVSVMQSWTSAEHRLARLDASGVIGVAPAGKWPFLMFGHSQRYVLKNVPRALDAPGEWVLHQGALNYVPRPVDALQGVDARWPRMPLLLQVAGDAASGRWVEHVALKGLAFAFTGQTSSMHGWVDTQAAVDMGAAVELDGARKVRILDCRIQHTGGYAIWLRRGVQDSEVSGCQLDDLGAGGIKVGEKLKASAPSITANNVITRNKITHTGREFPGAVGVWVGHSSGNQILDNVIAHTSYSGISVGWQWGFAEPSAINNKVQGNVLFDIGQGQLSDMGAIYTLGRAPGTEISGNFIRQVEDYAGFGPGGWGIYNDEGTSDVVVQNNVVVGARAGGYHLHYGRDNRVIANVLAGGRDAEVRWTAIDKSGSWRLERNGIAPAAAAWLDSRVADPRLIQGSNVFGVRQGGALTVEVGARVADVRIKGAPPDLGDHWQKVIAHAQQLTGDEVMTQSQVRTMRARPTRWSVDLAVVPVGGRPLDIRSSPKAPVEAVSVMRDDSGVPALLLHDGLPGMVAHDPHVFFPVDVDQGQMVSRFSVRLDPASVLVHEWRDAMTPYNVGPGVSLSADGIKVQGRVMAAVPVGQWLDVEVRQDLAAPRGQWFLRWRLSQEGSWRPLGPFVAAGPAAPQRWRWVGWYANGTAPAKTLMKGVEFARP